VETKINLTERIAGGIVGLLVGDALGVPYEFHSRESIPFFDEIEFEPPVRFRRSHAAVPPGTWSDDGAQALILLNTLLERGKFDAEHFAAGLVDWYDKGFMAVDGKVFDVGIQTADSIRQLKQGVEPRAAGGSSEYSNGNGSLMRVLPLAVWHNGSDSELIADAFAQSAVTHAHLRSKLCCALYCLWARRILQNDDDAWDSAIKTLDEIFPEGTIENIELETRICPKDVVYETNGSGYVVDSLRSARWACGNKTFEETVKAAISLGNDTDTTACIAGGIAGLKFGLNEIPERWRAGLRGKEIYRPLLDKLLTRL
jgi:ADP-ribosyl-[dinitrogen reductase] hydrolase